MGKIKSMLIKRTGKKLLSENGFTEDFNNNKRMLSLTMPSKKIRNILAGYMSRLKKQENKKNYAKHAV